MLFTANTVSEKEIKSINNFFDEFENQVETVSEEEKHKRNFCYKIHQLTCYLLLPKIC